jgi:hypothetical protein
MLFIFMSSACFTAVYFYVLSLRKPRVVIAN